MDSNKIQAKAIWNPDVKVDNQNKMLINGDTSNMMILSENKYPWSFKMYNTYMGNFWKPESISLKDDNEQYDALPPNEKEAFDNIISFLVFLDSLQTVNLPNINDYVTLPEINLLLVIQTYQEAIHSQSYGYVLESVVPAEKRRNIYDLAVTSPFMLKRNKFIADLYQEFVDNESEIGFVYVAMANYILEGIYFYAGFSFFYNLARQGKMTGVATEIKYINRDEISHLALFQGIFRELQKERPYLFTEETNNHLRAMMKEGAEHEIEWGAHIIGDGIEGLTAKGIEMYIKYLANYRLKMLGLDPVFDDAPDRNPLPWIDDYTNFNQFKTDFFEEHPINYAKESSALQMGELDDIEL